MARKSRKNHIESPTTVNDKIYSAAAYIRLSVEDSGKDDSDTIENQKYIVRQYIDSKPDFRLYDIYVDNGETGTNFTRNDWERLISDIKSAKVDCVVVKDLSRFGRNYIETCDYIEKIFPFMGVRFISINDNYDSAITANNSESLIVSLKNLINDFYAKDISLKVSAAMHTKQKNGEFIGAFAPYGYVKSEEDNHKLVIDEETAPVIRDIFRWKAEEIGDNMIARRLNEAGVISPSENLNRKGIRSRRDNGKPLLWQGQMIKSITSNLMYAGHMAQGKRLKALHDNRQKARNIPQSGWVVVRNTHEAIIGEELFNRVQEIKAERKKEFYDKKGRYAHIGISENVFMGMLICADCGTKMIRYKKVRNGKVYYNYICPVRAQNLDLSCSMKSVREKDLFDIVYSSILQQEDLVSGIEKSIQQIVAMESVKKSQRLTDKRIKELENKLKGISLHRAVLYENYADGDLNEDEYLYAKSTYDTDKAKYQKELDTLKREHCIYSGEFALTNKWITAIKKFQNEKELSREMVVELIQKIEVEGYNTLTIVWNYRDEYQAIAEILADNGEVDLISPGRSAKDALLLGHVTGEAK